MIREAVEQDIPRIVEMGMRFHLNSPYRKHLKANPEQMEILAKQLVASHTLLLSERDGEIFGMFGFVVFDHFMSGEKTAGEIFWWMEPEHRGAGMDLLREAQKIARHSGAKRMQMIAPDERVGKLYQRLGYTFVESSYQRTL